MNREGARGVENSAVSATIGIKMFSRFAQWTSHQAGRVQTFIGAIVVILLWAVSGPFFGLSNTWQLVINTGTTFITFLMVFLIQNTQNRDTQAIQLKLDELIRVTRDARNDMMNLEDRSDAELERLKEQFADVSDVPLEVPQVANKMNND